MLRASSKYENDYAIVIAGIRDFNKVYDKLIDGNKNISVSYNDTYNLLNNSHAALVTSGTATLETALFNVPQVVCYKSSWISYRIAKLLVKIKFISLVNLILDKESVKELIQNDLSINKLSKELSNILSGDCRKTMLDDYQVLKKVCGGKDASRLTASEMLKTILLNKSDN